MRFINVFIIISNLLFITQLYAQIGIGTPSPHKEADIHLANKNRTVILNHVDEKTALKDPQPGMIFYDTQDECFRGYANGEFTDFPFYEAGTTHWGVKGSGSRWEVDDYPNGAYFNIYHQVWVR